MQESASRLRVTTKGGATLVELTDRKLLDDVSIRQIGEEVNALTARSRQPRLVVDFTNVGQMSSSALGMLITLHKRIRERDGQLRLCGICPSILDIFRITRLDEVFQVHPTRETALQSIG